VHPGAVEAATTSNVSPTFRLTGRVVQHQQSGVTHCSGPARTPLDASLRSSRRPGESKVRDIGACSFSRTGRGRFESSRRTLPHAGTRTTVGVAELRLGCRTLGDGTRCERGVPCRHRRVCRDSDRRPSDHPCRGVRPVLRDAAGTGPGRYEHRGTWTPPRRRHRNALGCQTAHRRQGCLVRALRRPAVTRARAARSCEEPASASALDGDDAHHGESLTAGLAQDLGTPSKKGIEPMSAPLVQLFAGVTHPTRGPTDGHRSFRARLVTPKRVRRGGGVPPSGRGQLWGPRQLAGNHPSLSGAGHCRASRQRAVGSAAISSVRVSVPGLGQVPT
jgi:hypothetical protein